MVAIICWHEGHRDVLHGMHFSLVAFWLAFRSFWLCLIVFVRMICLNDVFLWKAMTGIALITFPNELMIFKGYFRYKMITLHNVSSDAQITKFFIS